MAKAQKTSVEVVLVVSDFQPDFEFVGDLEEAVEVIAYEPNVPVSFFDVPAVVKLTTVQDDCVGYGLHVWVLFLSVAFVYELGDAEQD